MSNGTKIAVNYGGCNRTLCNYNATKNACSNYAPTAKTKGYWRLPTQVEVSNWVSGFDLISKFLGDNGLNFCDYGATAGNGLVNCIGQNADDAYGSVITYADLVYTSTFKSSCGGYVVFSVNNGTPKNSGCTSGSSPYPASGRCVLDKIPSNPYRFSTFAGGGGAGAPYAKNLSIPNDLIQANIGGKIILTTNKGGAGAEAISNAKISQNSSQSGKSGSNGEYSQILIVDKNGNIGGFTSIKVNNKTYTVYGGNPGKVGFLNNVDDYIELIHGMGGLYDKVNLAIENIKGKVSPETKSSISYGINGTSGFDILDSAGNIIGSAGGVGGISGTGSNGGCGGMLSNGICLDKTDLCRKPENNQMCLLSNVANCTLAQVCNNVTSKDGISMMPPEAYPLNLINDSGFGLAGSGGGGGGWSLQGGYETLGKGGSGQDGYIFLYWQANSAN